eukprot:5015534-Prymnesium_polylepis.1
MAESVQRGRNSVEESILKISNCSAKKAASSGGGCSSRGSSTRPAYESVVREVSRRSQGEGVGIEGGGRRPRSLGIQLVLPRQPRCIGDARPCSRNSVGCVHPVGIDRSIPRVQSDKHPTSEQACQQQPRRMDPNVRAVLPHLCVRSDAQSMKRFEVRLSPETFRSRRSHRSGPSDALHVASFAWPVRTLRHQQRD